MKKQDLSQIRARSAVIGVTAVLAIVGLALMATSSAATYVFAIEAESGQSSGKATAASIGGVSGGSAITFGNGGATGQILFEDDFNGLAGSLPDANKWGEYCPGTMMAGSWGMIRCGADETLDGSGKLIVPANPQYGTGLMTKASQRQQYGTFSAWIKIPAEAGYWPAFWLINPANDNGTGGGGEIDILEGYTTWPKIYHDTVHAWGADGGHIWASPDDFNDMGVDLHAAYHKYSARVEPEKISFFFDDRSVGTVVTKTQHAAGKTWPFGPDNAEPHYMILDLALGGAGGAQSPAAQPAQMLVDRVEVRSL